MPLDVCGGQRTDLGSWSSPSTTWVSGVDFTKVARFMSLATNVFTHWGISGSWDLVFKCGNHIFLGSSNQSGEKFRLLGPNLTAVTSRSFTPRLKISGSYGGKTRAHPGQAVSQDRAMTLLLPCSFRVPRLGSWDVTTRVCTPHIPCSVHVHSALLCCT